MTMFYSAILCLCLFGDFVVEPIVPAPANEQAVGGLFDRDEKPAIVPDAAGGILKDVTEAAKDEISETGQTVRSQFQEFLDAVYTLIAAVSAAVAALLVVLVRGKALWDGLKGGGLWILKILARLRGKDAT